MIVQGSKAATRPWKIAYLLRICECSSHIARPGWSRDAIDEIDVNSSEFTDARYKQRRILTAEGWHQVLRFRSFINTRRQASR